jgi:ASC-1-like (ASCH) protein
MPEATVNGYRFVEKHQCHVCTPMLAGIKDNVYSVVIMPYTSLTSLIKPGDWIAFCGGTDEIVQRIVQEIRSYSNVLQLVKHETAEALLFYGEASVLRRRLITKFARCKCDSLLVVEFIPM